MKTIPKGNFYDNVLLMLSIAHFTKYEDNLFKTHIEKNSDKKMLTAKYYWLTIYYVENDNDNAKTHFDVFWELNQYENYAFYKKILQAIIHIKSQSVEIEHNEIKELLVIVKNSRLSSYINLTNQNETFINQG